MTFDTFFEKFELFAEAHDAVAKMRNLVLHLAVTGSLVQQDRNDEPASALLNRIAAHKEALVKERNFRGSTSVEAIPLGKGIRVIPSSWLWVRFGEIMVNRDGERIPVSKELRASKAKTYDYYGASGVIDKIDGFLFDKPLLLIGEDGANLINRSTPIAFMARGQYWVNNHAHVIDGISEDLLRYIELHINATNLEPYVTGSAQPKMNQAKMNSIPIALPPLAEQKRIVAKVDELMALCDRLEAQQQERETQHAALARASQSRFAEAPTPANLDYLFHKSYTIPPADLRKSILTLAVQGRLIPQDPNDETASNGLAKVLRDRESIEKRLRIKPPIPVEADAGHTPELPSGWCYASPDQMTAFHKNALTIGPFGSSLLKSDYADEGVPLVFVRDIRSESFGGPNTRFVVDAKAEELISHFVKSGDLLITKMGDPPGDTAIYPRDRPPAIITADCIKLTPHARVVIAEYLRFAIRASQVANQFADITLGVAQQKVSLGRFRCIAVPLPPLAEQRRIVAKVDELMALVDSLETQLRAARESASALLEAVVASLLDGNAMPKRPRPIFEPTKYAIQLIAGVMNGLARPVGLEELNAAFALLFHSNELKPLLADTCGPEGRDHFVGFAQPNEPGAFLNALKILGRSGAITHSNEKGPVVLRVGPGDLPPRDPVIEGDAAYLAKIMDLVPVLEQDFAPPRNEIQTLREALLAN